MTERNQLGSHIVYRHTSFDADHGGVTNVPQCPWSIESIGGYFVVRTNNGQPLVFISYREGVARQSIARLLTRDAARRIAMGIAKLPDLVQWLSKRAH